MATARVDDMGDGVDGNVGPGQPTPREARSRASATPEADTNTFGLTDGANLVLTKGQIQTGERCFRLSGSTLRP